TRYILVLLTCARLSFPFFFYSYRHHRYLHSFPTRRSSDLLTSRCISRPTKSSSGRRGCFPPPAPCILPIAPCAASKPSGSAKSSDRKSTRLNSSHVEISYAVFCLKKKKTDRRQ